MPGMKHRVFGIMGAAAMSAAATGAHATEFNVPGGLLENALDAFSQQAGVHLLVPTDEMHGVRTRGVKGDLAASTALTRILSGTGFVAKQDVSGVTGIVRQQAQPKPPQHSENVLPVRLASAAASSVETVVVTSSKIKGDIQTVPIAITALSQEQLTSRQIAGGPDLVKEVPNLTFTKTNFSGYSIQIRGIGTQAISVTTDPAVAVALNDIPFIRNHFFEQEFFDVNQVEVLRGPQGTLYGRNATAGVVNVISAKPTNQFEAMLSADWGNYTNRRYEGMVNIPIVDDRLDLRVAGEWTKRDGYSFNTLNNSPIDGRDLWSTRVTVGWKPFAKVQAYLVWEHFQEDDDRLRSGKQLCKTAPLPTEVGGATVAGHYIGVSAYQPDNYLTQGCLPVGLYDKGDPAHGDYGAFGVPNSLALPYAGSIGILYAPVRQNFNIYSDVSQSQNLRNIESQINPRYRAKNDTLELNADYNLTPTLTFTSQTGFNRDFLWSTEDYNRFNTAPGAFIYNPPGTFGNQQHIVTLDPLAGTNGIPANAAVFCDPQIGCSDRLVAQDLDVEHAWQLSQEFRLASNFKGRFNFSFGGNYLHYETQENYYVFINSLTTVGATGFSDLGALSLWIPGVSDNHDCLVGGFANVVLNAAHDIQSNQCMYIDPNPITEVNGEGHNYFVSHNPYVLNSYAGFGEAYYSITKELKLTGGLRWTDDEKHFTMIPSELLVPGYGYPSTGVVDQKWNQWTGRAAADWSPKLDFTDQTLIYGSFAHGYKAGGANPPGAVLLTTTEGTSSGNVNIPIHPLTFKPEFVDAYELGTKNTLADGGITLNGDVFFYNYKGYQISRIVDRTAINDNFDATVKGAELEAMWEPVPGLKFNFAGGYEDTRIKDGQSSVDLMDRTAGNPNWIVLKPFVSQASNCIVPVYVVAAILDSDSGSNTGAYGLSRVCGLAYTVHVDPATGGTYVPNPTAVKPGTTGGGFAPGYVGFDPLAGTTGDPYVGQNISGGIDYGAVPNNGEGFSKNVGGNELPNAPHFTTSLSVDYTIPVSQDWAATAHSDFYWQSQSWARVFNSRPYDKIRGYSNVNLAVILTSASGWQVMGYLKNVFDTTAITGDFLNSDDSGLTTNVFLTDPRLFGVRVTKNW